jgi:hypothetical protein
LSEPTRALLRSAIAESLTGNGEGSPSLRAALQTAAAEAREREMRPEELIIELKAIFTSAMHGKGMAVPADENRLREWLVTNCLKAYYGKN